MKKLIDFHVWLELAEQHFTLAKISYRHKPLLPYGVCYHSHRCVSTYLKTILIKAGSDFPGTHDLVYLKNLCLKLGIVIDYRDDYLDILADLGARVHNPANIISVAEQNEALKIVSEFRRQAKKYLNSNVLHPK